MTSNQIEAMKAKEAERSNRAREHENYRSNQAKEQENRAERKRKTVEMTTNAALDVARLISGSADNKMSNVAKIAPAVIAAANDPSWYKVSDQVVKDAANISTFVPTGTLPLADQAIARDFNATTSTTSTEYDGHRFATSGVMIFNYYPTIGNNLGNYSNSDPVNIAAQNIYSFVRHANSGSKVYERADYMMYMLACDSIIQYYAWMRRIYGLAMNTSVFNTYQPQEIIKALGVDYDDLVANLAQFRSYINVFVARSNVLAMPSDFPYFARHAFLSSNLFTDSNSKKHQLYVFNPVVLYQWAIDSGNNATMLDPVFLNSGTLLKVSDMVTFGNNLLKALVDQEDVGIMTGDTLKAFGDDKLVRLPEVDDGYICPIVYSQEVLDQINNITFVKKGVYALDLNQFSDYRGNVVSMHVGGYNNGMLGDNYSKENISIHQDTSTQSIYQNMVFSRPVFQNQNGGWNEYHVGLLASNLENVTLNFSSDKVDPDQVMVGTRLTNTISPSGVAAGTGTNIWEYSYTVQSCGSEIIWNGFILKNYFDVNLGQKVTTAIEIYDGVPISTGYLSGVNYTDDGRQIFPQVLVDSISDFDWHPRLYCPVVYESEALSLKSVVPTLLNVCRPAFLFDRNMDSIQTSQTIANMHRAALLGEFNVAEMGVTPRSNLKMISK